MINLRTVSVSVSLHCYMYKVYMFSLKVTRERNVFIKLNKSLFSIFLEKCQFINEARAL